MRPIDERSPTPIPRRASETSSNSSKEPVKAKSPAPAASPAAKPVESPTKKATILDKKDSPAPSNPSGSRELTRRQANLAIELTSGSGFTPAIATDDRKPDVVPVHDVDGPSDPADSEEPKKDKDPELDHLVKDPTKKDQRSDLKLKPPYSPRSETPEVPDLSGLEPAKREEQKDGSVKKTFEQDGVTYEVVRDKDGKVTTSFTSDGVSYSKEENKDGSSTLNLFSDLSEDRRYNREITTDAEGKVSDVSSVVESHRDSQGRFSFQEKKLTVGPDGKRTLEEEVRRPDGGRANYTKVTNVDGTGKEIYDSSLGETKLRRTTKMGRDGSSETRTEKSYQSDQDLEELIDVPESPSHGIGKQPDLPTDGREPTLVSEVTVVTDDGKGAKKLQYSEESYSQTSNEVEVTGELPSGLEVDSGETNLTRTVTRVKVPGDDGKLEESTGVSQTARLVANRDSGGEVVFSNTSTWNGKGESASSYSVEGLSETELKEISPRAGRGAPKPKVPGLSVGDVGLPLLSNSLAPAPSARSSREKNAWLNGRNADYHLPLRPNGSGPRGLDEKDAEWLDEDSIDFTREVSFDKEGKVAATGITYGSTDSDGDGRTISASKTPDGPLTWTYSDVSNDGQDFKRQTVVEGTELSTYEERVTHGPGEFSYKSETTEAGERIESKSASRSKVTRAEIQEAVEEGTLTEAQAKAVLAGKGPYYLETSQASAEPLVDDDGKLRVDGDGKPIQTGYEQFTSKLSNNRGFEAVEYDQSQTDDNGDITTSHLSSVTDPTKKPPVTGTLETTDADFNRETSQIQIDNKGRFLSDGEVVGQFDLGKADLEAFLQSGGSADDLFIGALDTVKGAAEVPENLQEWGNPRFQPSAKLASGADKLAKGTTILGTLIGAQQIFAGFQGDNDYEQILGGVGLVSTGGESALAAIGGLTDEASKAGKILKFSGKALGSVGGVVSVGFGLRDLWTADSGWDRAAGGLSVAAGAVAIGSLWFGPPGWIVGGVVSGVLGLASIVVGSQDDIGEHDREPIDNRLK